MKHFPIPSVTKPVSGCLKRRFLTHTVLPLLSVSLMLAAAPVLAASTTVGTPAQTAAGQTVLPNLDFATIRDAFYAHQIRAHAQPLDETRIFADKDRIRLKHIYLHENGEDKVAFFYPARAYTKDNGEKRYFVAVEKAVQENDGLEDCHACESEITIFLFKKEHGGFRLLSRSAAPTNRSEVNGSYGVNAIRPDTLKIRKIGRNRYGALVTHGDMHFGFTITALWVLVFDENAPIRLVPVQGALDEDTSGAYVDNSPKTYRYTGKVSVVDNGAAYFPLKIVYRGTKPDRSGEVRPFNTTRYFRYRPQKGRYE